LFRKLGRLTKVLQVVPLRGSRSASHEFFAFRKHGEQTHSPSTLRALQNVKIKGSLKELRP
jgi:hypothetical protein